MSSRWKTAAAAATTVATMQTKTRARKAQRGVPLNLMVVGQSGLGKSTFVRTLVGKELVPARDYEQFNDLSERTVDISTYSEDIEAEGQKIILTVIDTPGFGDNINNSKGFIKILEYVETQHKRFLAEESRVQRNAKFQDTRVHALLYFIPATGHSLRDVDIVFMKQLGKRVNIIPVIAKSDSLLPSEVKEFKKRINEDIQKFDIPIFDFPVNSEDDEDIVQENNEFRSHLPFTIIGSGQKFDVGGQMVFARKYPWGTVAVEDEKNSDFGTLKMIILSSHLEVLKEVTNDVHYENYRQESLQKGVDTSKLEQELNELDKQEKDQREKEKSEKEKRIQLKQEWKRNPVERDLKPTVSKGGDESDRTSIISDEGKKKKKSKKADGDDEKKEKKKKKKEKEEGKEAPEDDKEDEEEE